MNFVPSKRLLWAVALIVVPTALVLGMAGAPIPVLVLAGVLVIGLAAIDALISVSLLSGVKVELPELVRTSKSKTFDLQGTVLRQRASLFARWSWACRFRRRWKRSRRDDPGHLADGFRPRPPSSGRCRPWNAAHFKWTALIWKRRRGLAFGTCGAVVACVCEVRVYPDLSRERHLLAPLFFRRGVIGAHQVRQLGKGREFEQLRAYSPGDSYGDVYWKGTAKRRFPVTMMYQIERTQEMHVILDISRRSARPLEFTGTAPHGDARFLPKTQCDRFLQAALVLALAAEQQNDRFGMMVFSDQVHTTLPAGAGRAHYNACRDALYTLEPRVVSPDFEELFIQVGNRLRHRSLLIVLTDLGEPWLAESFAESVRQAARRHVVLVHVLGSREFQPLFSRHDEVRDADDLYPRLAGHLMWSDLQETTKQLKQLGVHLTSSLQEGLIADVVSEYLKVKKRQLL